MQGKKQKMIVFLGLENFATLIFLILFLVVLIQILCRFIFKVSVPWTEELSRFIFIWVSFFGAALATRKKEHLTVTFFYKKFSRKSQQIMEIVFNLAKMYFLYLIIQGGYQMMKINWNIVATTLSWFYMRYLYMFGIIFLGIMFIFLIINTVETMIELVGKGEGNSDY